MSEQNVITEEQVHTNPLLASVVEKGEESELKNFLV